MTTQQYDMVKYINSLPERELTLPTKEVMFSIFTSILLRVPIGEADCNICYQHVKDKLTLLCIQYEKDKLLRESNDIKNNNSKDY